MPETTYNPSITVDTGLYCPVCRGAIQANLTDSSVGPIIWDTFCDNDRKDDAHRLTDIFEQFIEMVDSGLGMGWAREAWDNYHKETAETCHCGHPRARHVGGGAGYCSPCLQGTNPEWEHVFAIAKAEPPTKETE